MEMTSDHMLFDAELRPHRSLGRKGFTILMIVVTLISVSVGVAFVIVGAWPVLGFFGLDVLAVYAAFRWSYRTARLRETVRMTPDALQVRRIQPSGAWEQWDFQPYWVRFSLDERDDDNPVITLSERQVSVSLGRFLPKSERLDFAKALNAALNHAKSGAQTA
jgi:Integral membrane protein